MSSCVMADYVVAIAETSESENELIPSSRQTASDEERYAALDKKHYSLRRAKEQANYREVSSSSEDEYSQLPTPTNTGKSLRYNDGGETSKSRLSRARFRPIPGLKMDGVMGEESSSEETESAVSRQSEGEDIPVFDLTCDTSSSEDEFEKASGGLPFYPELRKGPASQGPRALTPPPPSPQSDAASDAG